MVWVTAFECATVIEFWVKKYVIKVDGFYVHNFFFWILSIFFLLFMNRGWFTWLYRQKKMKGVYSIIISKFFVWCQEKKTNIFVF